MKTDRKLISMKDYVLEQKQIWNHDNTMHASANYVTATVNYANFLTLQLELGQFVPCDLEGNVLSEPEGFMVYKGWLKDDKYWEGADLKLIKQYQQAKDRVIFEGFEHHKLGDMITNGSTSFSRLSLIDGEYKIENAVHDSIIITPQAVETYKI